MILNKKIIKYNMKNIYKQTYIIALISFLAAFSSSIFVASVIPMSKVFGISIGTIILIRIMSDALGYIGKSFMAFFSDWIGNRKTFLLIGYCPALLIKPTLFLCTFNFIPIAWKVILISGANIIDKFFNNARDGVRDAYILDDCAKEDISANITFRKSVSYFGTISGALFTLIYLYFSSNYPLLYAISMISGISSVFVIIYFIKDKPNTLKNDTRELFSNISLIKTKYNISYSSIAICCLGIFFLFFGKINEMMFSKAAIALDFPTKYVGGFYLIFYCCSCLMSAFITFYKSNSILYYLVFSTICIIINSILFLGNVNLFLLIISLCIYGMHNAVLENFIISYTSKIFHKIPSKGSLLGIINIVTGLSLLCNTQLTKFILNKNLFYTLSISATVSILSLIIFIYQSRSKNEISKS